MRIWLDRIGVKRRNRPEGWAKPLGRHVKCWFERKIYGVDSRETYDLDFTWRMWLYEHLKMFLKKAESVVDLDEELLNYDGKMHSMKELIEMMLERLEFSLDPKKDYDDYDAKQFAYVHEVEKIWAVIAPAMWW